MDNSPLAYIFSDENEIALELSKELIEKGCKAVFPSSSNFGEASPSYIFLIGKIDENILKFAEANFIKTQVILSKRTNIETENPNLEVIYLDEEYFKSPELAKEITPKLIRAIFSYGFGKKETVIEKTETKKEPEREVREIKIKPIEPIRIIKEAKVEVKKEVKQIKLPVQEPVKVIPKKKGKKIKYVLVTILILFWILSIPFVCLLGSVLALKAGYSHITRLDLPRADFYFNFSDRLASIANVGPAHFIVEADTAGLKASAAIRIAQAISTEVSQKSDYDLKGQSSELYLNLDDLYKETSLLEADLSGNSVQNFFLPGGFSLDKLRQYIFNFRIFAQNLPSILGSEKQTNYLVLMQDDTELRPTGGLIKSFQELTFDGGKLISNTQLDVSQADNQLRGQVDPPLPLQKYLGVNSWSLRDSNWDPDFRISAAKAQWFLEKETSQNTDGVIAIDSKFLQKISWGQDLIEGLNAKDVQIFLNDENIESAVSDLNWDGGVKPNSIGIVEANLGKNKVNPSVNRSANLQVNSGNYKLQINYENLSKTDHYKVYVRVIAPTGVTPPDGQYVDIAPQSKKQIAFSWSDSKTHDFIVRKQPGVSSSPTNIVIDGKTSYNTSLGADYDVNN